MSDVKTLVNDIRKLNDSINRYADRIVLEDTEGRAFLITRVGTIGLKTDNPKIVLILEDIV